MRPRNKTETKHDWDRKVWDGIFVVTMVYVTWAGDDMEGIEQDGAIARVRRWDVNFRNDESNHIVRVDDIVHRIVNSKICWHMWQ